MKNIPDNKNGVPFEHYRERFAGMEPEAMSRRSGFPYDAARQSFRLHLMGRPVEMQWPEMRLSYAGGAEISAKPTVMLVARALMEGLGRQVSGSFLAYAEVPWGNVYLQQFRGRCIMRLAFGFGSRLDAFARACEALGGSKCGEGDCGYVIEFLDGLYVKLILWAGDDEFPPSAQILFSDNFPAMFTAEDMAVVGDVLISALKAVK